MRPVSFGDELALAAFVVGGSAFVILLGCSSTDTAAFKPTLVGSGASGFRSAGGQGGGSGAGANGFVGGAGSTAGAGGAVAHKTGNGGSVAAAGSGAAARAIASSGGVTATDAGAADAATSAGGIVNAGSGGTKADGGAGAGAGGRVATSGGASGSGGRAPLQPTGCREGNDWVKLCGNGVIDPGEQCDGTNLRGATCSDIDPRYTGPIVCGPDCDWDATGCVLQQRCGNGIIDRGEDCEPGLFDTSKAHPCADFPPHTGNPGNVTCNEACRYDFSDCVGGQPKCGNGVIDSGEECDGAQSNILSCWSYNYAAGIIGCRPDCQLDVTGCIACDGSHCGDNELGGGEACDGTNFAGQTCLSAGYQWGQLGCTPRCSLDTSGCHGCLITPVGNHCQ